MKCRKLSLVYRYKNLYINNLYIILEAKKVA